MHTAEKWRLITNPLVNSYKRLVPGYGAPTELTWTDSDQKSLVRIPFFRGQESMVELMEPGCCGKSLSCAGGMPGSRDGRYSKTAGSSESGGNGESGLSSGDFERSNRYF